ncbi:MAG: hypothetical protein HYY25_13450 [Candidatus Wallbacteria bacterium]|nr:hypothetical protein [Candidatus Wallbacteria bacterium]
MMRSQRGAAMILAIGLAAGCGDTDAGSAASAGSVPAQRAEAPAIQDWRRTLFGAAYQQELVLERRALREDLIRLVARLARSAARAEAMTGAGPGGPHGRSRTTLEEDTTYLSERGVLPESMRSETATPLDRGQASLVVARYLGLQGGVSGTVFGLSPRVAYRDLVFRGVMPGGGEHYRMSGADLLSMLAKVRGYQRARRRT